LPRHDVELPLLGSILHSNRAQVARAIQKVMAGGRRIGLSFKGAPTPRPENPLVLLAEVFIGKGLNLLTYDPEGQLSPFLGATFPGSKQIGLHDTTVLDQHIRDDQVILDLVHMASTASSSRAISMPVLVVTT
jgi:GDP-mannose 6-dehydrogenase